MAIDLTKEASPAIETLVKVLVNVYEPNRKAPRDKNYPFRYWLQRGLNIEPGTRHTSGIALDIMLHYANNSDYQIGRRIIAGLVHTFELMQWSSFIYTVRNQRTSSIKPVHFIVFGADGKGYDAPDRKKLKAYEWTAPDHENHIHIDWVNLNQKNPEPISKKYPYKITPEAERTGFELPLENFLRNASEAEVDAILNNMFSTMTDAQVGNQLTPPAMTPPVVTPPPTTPWQQNSKIIISASVGNGGINRPDDVKIIQQALNRIPEKNGRPAPLLKEDGMCGPMTIGAISNFQRLNNLGFSDGRVDPGGRTNAMLNNLA